MEVKPYSALKMSQQLVKKLEEAEIPQLVEYAGILFSHVEPDVKRSELLLMIAASLVYGPNYFLTDIYNGVFETTISVEEVDFNN